LLRGKVRKWWAYYIKKGGGGGGIKTEKGDQDRLTRAAHKEKGHEGKLTEIKMARGAPKKWRGVATGQCAKGLSDHLGTSK